MEPGPSTRGFWGLLSLDRFGSPAIAVERLLPSGSLTSASLRRRETSLFQALGLSPIRRASDLPYG